MSDDLAAFLAVRLSEREERAPEIHNRYDCDLNLLVYFGECNCQERQRVLREVAAGRKILAEYERLSAEYAGFRHGANQAAMLAARTAAAVLASVDSEHPDYREDFRP